MNQRKLVTISVAGGLAIAIALGAIAWFALGETRGVVAGVLAGLGLILFIYFGLLITQDNNK